MRLKMLATVLLWSPILASAATNSWTAVGPGGAWVNALVFGDTAGTVFIAANSGVYRSLDDGVDWQPVKTDFPGNVPSGIAPDPSDSTRVYVVAATAPWLYISTDGGATLQAAATLPSTVTAARMVGVSHDGNTLYIASAGQIFSSTDRGTTWTQRTAISSDPVALPLSLIVDPTDANSVYVSIQLSTSGLMQVVATHDGGATWQILTSEPVVGPEPTLAINPANPMQLWVARFDGLKTSLDRGLTWTNVLPGVGVSGVSVDPENPASVYAVSDHGVVYRSTDNGADWTSAIGSPSAGGPCCIAVDPTQSARILVAGMAGVAGSSDSGSTWSAQEAGLLASNVMGLSADPTTDRIYANLPTQGIFASTAGAASFLPVNNAELFSLQYGAANPGYTSIDVSAMLARPGGLLASLGAGLAISQDTGNTWALSQVVPLGSGSQQLFFLASSAATPLTVLGAGVSSMFVSNDGGITWTAANSGLPANSGIGNLLAAQSNPQIAYAGLYTTGSGTNLGLYRTTNGGLSWSAAMATPSAGPQVLLAVDPVSAGTLYGSTASTLLKSTDSGSTWSALPLSTSLTGGQTFWFAIDPVHPQIMVAANFGIARSVDGGATWETVLPIGLPVWQITGLLFDPVRPESLLVATSNTGVQQITIAPDLSLTSSGPAGFVAIGAPLSFGFTLSNLGPFAATDATVTVQLPTTAQSVAITAAGGTCVTASAMASCTFPVLRSGASVPVTVTANTMTAGSFQVRGSVAADQPDSNAQNNSVTLAATVASIADLSVSVSGNSAAQTGDSLIYDISVSNAGPNTAVAPVLTFQLAGGLTPGTITAGTGSCSVNSAALVTCALSDLAAGSSVKVTVAATAAAAGTLVSNAYATSTTYDPSLANNGANVSTSVSAPPSSGSGTAKSGGGGLSPWDLVELCLLCGFRLWNLTMRRS